MSTKTVSEQLFIPKKIKVGYQTREDTYTKRLAYVIYYDSKGVLRKKDSWEGWIDHGVKPGATRWQYSTGGGAYIPLEPREPLPTHDFDNVPMSGFVLNKGVGGARESYGWNARNEYIRVYDPRNFEFEISIANLLFILKECNAYKGKGLEGEFVYSWEGKELVLLPTCSQEYKNSTKFTDLQKSKIGVKDLVPGFTYETKRQVSLIYLGKFDCLDIKYQFSTEAIITKKYVFVNPEIIIGKTKKGYMTHFTNLVTLSSLETIANVQNNSVVPNYAELMEEALKTDILAPVEKIKQLPVDLSTQAHNQGYYRREKEDLGNLFKEIGKDEFQSYAVKVKFNYDRNFLSGRHYNIDSYSLIPNKILKFVDGKVEIKILTEKKDKTYAPNDIAVRNFVTLSVLTSSGKEYKLN